MSDTSTTDDEPEYRTCEQCNYTRLADADEAPSDVPVESGQGGHTHRRVWTLCDGCRRELVGTVRPCPYCLESLAQDQRPADCPHAPAAEHCTAAPAMFTGTVVQSDPLVLDDGTVTVSVEDTPGSWDLGEQATAVGEYVGTCGPYAARMDAEEVREVNDS